MKSYLSKAFDLYKFHASKIFIFSLLATIPALCSLLLVYSGGFSRESVVITIILPVIGALIGVFFQIIFINLAKNPTASNQDLFNITFARFFPYLGTILLQGIALAGLYLLFIIPGIIFTTRWIFTPYIVASTDKAGVKAISRSAKITKGNWWNVYGTSLGFGLLVGLLALVLFSLLMLVILIGAQDLSLNGLLDRFHSINIQGSSLPLDIFSYIVTILITPLSPLFFFFVYQKYDQQYKNTQAAQYK